MFKQTFKLQENGTNVKTEVLAGITTFNQMELHPVIAPALILVGSMMFKGISKINWRDFSEALPAFLTLLIMPLTFSITEGISFGFIPYSFLKLISGRGREVHWIVYTFAALFIMRYIFL